MRLTLVQFIEDDPHQADWWRYSRPQVVPSPPITERPHRCWCVFDLAEAKEEQAEWDRTHPRG